RWPRLTTRYGLVEKEASFGFPFGGIVGFPVNIFLDVVRGRERTRFGEVGRAVRFLARGGVDFLDRRFVEHAFRDQRLLENLDRILRAPVFFDFLFAAIGVVGIGDGVAAITIGVDLDCARTRLFAREGEKLVHARAHFVDVVP